MNPLVAVINTAARIGNWILDTRLDAVLCKLSNDLSGDDE
jgi:hypothetical protein